MVGRPEPPGKESVNRVVEPMKKKLKSLSEPPRRACNEYIATAKAGKAVARQRADDLSDRQLRAVSVGQVVTSLAVGGLFLAWYPAAVSAQSASEQAGGLMCESGLGELITLAFGAITVFLILLSAWRGMMAAKDMGSARPDKKSDGREEAKGSVVTMLGVFVLPMLALGMDQVGISTISCVDFTNVF